MNIECYGHKGIARLHQHVPLGRAISSQLINFFSDLRALIANIPDKVVRWCPDGDFLGPAFPANRAQHISDLHCKFAGPHHL